MKGALFLALTQPRPFPMDLHHSWGGPFAVEKMYFLVHKVIRNRSIWGPCQFFFITKHLVKILPIYLSGNMKEFIWKKSGKVKNLYGTCEGFLKKNEKHIWKNAEFD